MNARERKREERRQRLHDFNIQDITEFAQEIVAKHADDPATMHRLLDERLLRIAESYGYTELVNIYKTVILGYDIPGETP